MFRRRDVCIAILIGAVALLLLFFDRIKNSISDENNASLVMLSRGVNIFYTVTQENGVLVNLDSPFNQITIEDVFQIKQAGLNHIRLAISPYPLMPDDRFDPEAWKTKNAEIFLHRIHDIIKLFIDNDVVVVLAVMPNEQTFERLYHTPEYGDEWVHFFHAWSKEFSRYPSSKLIFETLNEPRFSLFIARDLGTTSNLDAHYPISLLKESNARWIPLENRFLSAIRAEAPTHTMVATADGFSDPTALALRAPSSYPNVIHAFHYYAPLIFTHQGANWVSNFSVSQLGGLTYPSENTNCTEVQGASRPEDQKIISHYCNSGWNEARHRKELSAVRDWSTQHKIPVWLSEFGAYPLRIDDNSMKNYYRDIQKVAGEYGFSWCAWEYTNWLGRFEKLSLKETPLPADK